MIDRIPFLIAEEILVYVQWVHETDIFVGRNWIYHTHFARLCFQFILVITGPCVASQIADTGIRFAEASGEVINGVLHSEVATALVHNVLLNLSHLRRRSSISCSRIVKPALAQVLSVQCSLSLHRGLSLVYVSNIHHLLLVLRIIYELIGQKQLFHFHRVVQ